MAGSANTNVKDLHGVVGIYFNSTVGSGMVGKVCKAKCGTLPCVAKVFDKSVVLPDSKNKLAEFENHCKRLLSLRHPSLVQYLGTATGANMELPFLFMEVLNQNLTQFLEAATSPLPFHVQLNIGYDVALGLSFLHFNSLVHGSISSNNVMLIGEGSRAKLADFGLYKFTSPSDTVSDKNSAFKYLAPEVLSNQNFSSLSDSFSFGVLLLQIMTRKAPDPARDLDKEKAEVKQRQSDISLAGSDNQLLPLALHCLKDSESERPTSQSICEELATVRKNDLYLKSRETYLTTLDEMRKKMVSNESLLKEQEENIHKLELGHEEEIKTIKESHEKEIEIVKSSYEEKLKILESKNSSKNSEIEEKIKDEEEVERLGESVDKEVVQSKGEDADSPREDGELTVEELDVRTTNSSEDVSCASAAPEAAVVSSLPEKTSLEEEQGNSDICPNKPEELVEIRTIAESDRDRAPCEARDEIAAPESPPSEEHVPDEEYGGKENIQVEDSSVTEDRSLLDTTDVTLENTSSVYDPNDISEASLPDDIDHTPNEDEKWSMRSPAPENMCSLYGTAVVHENIAYFSRHYDIYYYSLSKDKWTQMKPSSYQNFSMVVLDDSIITVGGISREMKRTKNLYGFSKGRWRIRYSPMPQHRVCAAALATPTHLIVAGGRDKQELDGIDIMNRSTSQWNSLLHSLPEKMGHPQMALCEDFLYLSEETNVYSICVTELIDSAENPGSSKFSWNRGKELPSHMAGGSLVSCQSDVLLVGGHDKNDTATGDARRYDRDSEVWAIAESFPVPCGGTLVALLPGNLLLIVGGWSGAHFYNTTHVARLNGNV